MWQSESILKKSRGWPCKIGNVFVKYIHKELDSVLVLSRASWSRRPPSGKLRSRSLLLWARCERQAWRGRGRVHHDYRNTRGPPAEVRIRASSWTTTCALSYDGRKARPHTCWTQEYHRPSVARDRVEGLRVQTSPANHFHYCYGTVTLTRMLLMKADEVSCDITIHTRSTGHSPALCQMKTYRTTVTPRSKLLNVPSCSCNPVFQDDVTPCRRTEGS